MWFFISYSAAHMWRYHNRWNPPVRDYYLPESYQRLYKAKSYTFSMNILKERIDLKDMPPSTHALLVDLNQTHEVV